LTGIEFTRVLECPGKKDIQENFRKTQGSNCWKTAFNIEQGNVGARFRGNYLERYLNEITQMLVLW
jgi:hypothetical protein